MKGCLLEKQANAESRPLNYTEVPDPEPGPGELLVRVICCGVCRTDLHVVEGDLEPRKMPLIPGHQIVGEVVDAGKGAEGHPAGSIIGGAWLNRTCGTCRFCTSGRENLCDSPDFTGWTRDGGFAEYAVIPASFAYPIPPGIEPVNAAPLMCAGIIGYRAMKLTGIEDWQGARLGIYGFGAAGHVAIQLARHRGADVYVATRDRERHQALAEDLGAVWVGDTYDIPPEKLDASIIFAPAGEIVPPALEALEKGGSLVLGGIHMSPIPEFEYSLIYGERIVRSVANNTREDGEEFLKEAVEAGVKTSVETFGLEEANDALIALKTDAIKGAAVLVVS
ncbi:MAG: zinc-dependent alcohol dehydrogenase family protein [Aridibacter famidurans]|nr:zinc-dependent alcohol dehydrogenase family protein [Aridibacter famidurans]